MKKAVLIGVPHHNNLGDHAIVLAEREYIENNFKENMGKVMSSDRENYSDGNGAVYAITPTSDGGYLLGRGYENTNGGGAGYITKIDSNGKKIWEKVMSSDRENYSDGNGAVYAICESK